MTGLLRKAVAEAVGPDALLPEEEGFGNHGGDAEGGGRPVVAAPGSEADVARLLERAGEEGWRVLPAGLGSWLEGGGRAEADLVLSTRRLDGLDVYEPADLTFTAGAGMSMERLSRLTAAEGQWLPLDPPGWREGSLGAVTALGVGGPLRHAYGTPRDHVLGLTLVTGDGRILRWGGRVVKNVAGFDLTRLSVGSWGALGVITSVSARLFPLPDRDVTLLLTGCDAHELRETVGHVARSSLPLAALELLDPLPEGAGLPGGAGVAIRLLGTRAQIRGMEAGLEKEVPDLAGTRTTLRLEGKASRDLHLRLSRWEEGAALVLRLSLLSSRLPALVERARELTLELAGGDGGDAEMRLSAHVGAGILRAAFRRAPSGEEGTETERWSRVLGGLRRELEKEGGSLVVSSGPPELVRRVGPWGGMGGEKALVSGLRREFDPRGTLATVRFSS